MWLALLALAAAKTPDPVLAAAEQQLDKEKVVAYFAAARAKELEEEKAFRAQAGERSDKLYSQLKDASGKYWREHKARVQAEKAARAVGSSLHTASKDIDREVAKLQQHARAQNAAVEAAQEEVTKVRAEEREESARLAKAKAEARAARGVAAALESRNERETAAHELQSQADAAERKRLEAENAQLHKDLANVTETAADQVAKARRDAGRARAALKEDGELIERVKQTAEAEVEQVRAQAVASQHEQQQKVDAQLQKEAAALQQLKKDRAELTAVAEAAVAKAEKLEKHAKAKHHKHHHKHARTEGHHMVSLKFLHAVE